jgi:hypothetical protein
VESVLVVVAADFVVGCDKVVENSLVDSVVPSLVLVRGTMVEVVGATIVVVGVNWASTELEVGVIVAATVLVILGDAVVVITEDIVLVDDTVGKCPIIFVVIVSVPVEVDPGVVLEIDDVDCSFVEARFVDVAVFSDMDDEAVDIVGVTDVPAVR